jgi:hypothetical protein
MGFCGTAIDIDLSAFARPLGFRSRAIETRDIEPLIETHRQHDCTVFSALAKVHARLV